MRNRNTKSKQLSMIESEQQQKKDKEEMIGSTKEHNLKKYT